MSVSSLRFSVPVDIRFIHIRDRLTFSSEHPNFKLYRIAASLLPNSSQSSALSYDAL